MKTSAAVPAASRPKRVRDSLSDAPGPPLSLFSDAPFSNESTSAEASLAIRPHVARLEGVVLEYIRSQGSFGATDEEIERGTKLIHQTASARRRGLVLKDLVAEAGKYRLTFSGRRAIVWVVKEAAK